MTARWHGGVGGSKVGRPMRGFEAWLKAERTAHSLGKLERAANAFMILCSAL